MQALHRFDYFGYFIYLEQNIYFAILSNNPNAILFSYFAVPTFNCYWNLFEILFCLQEPSFLRSRCFVDALQRSKNEWTRSFWIS